jgi:hypothetical protein
MKRLMAMAKDSTHGGFEPRMTSDPLLVSKAIFDWWWTDADNRAAFRRRVDPRLRPPSCFMVCAEEARSAATTIRVDIVDEQNLKPPPDQNAVAVVSQP